MALLSVLGLLVCGAAARAGTAAGASAQTVPYGTPIALGDLDPALRQSIGQYVGWYMGRWVGDCSATDVPYTQAIGGYCATVLRLYHGWAHVAINKFATDDTGIDYLFHHEPTGVWTALGPDLLALTVLHRAAFDPARGACVGAQPTFPGDWQSYVSSRSVAAGDSVTLSLRNGAPAPDGTVGLHLYVHRSGDPTWYPTALFAHGGDWTDPLSYPDDFFTEYGGPTGDLTGTYTVYWVSDDAQLVACDGFVIGG